MANAINDSHIQGKFGKQALDDVISKLQDTNVKAIYEKVKSKIEAGILDVKKLRERVMTAKEGSESDQAALLYDLAELKGKEAEITKEINLETDETQVKELQKKLIEVQNDMMDNALANRSIGRSASSIFRIRQLWVNREKSVVDMVEEYKAANNIKELTPEQERHVKERFNLIQEGRQKLRSAKIALDRALEENAKLKEENKKLEELKNKATVQKRADRSIRSADAIKKSNERISKTKDYLKSLVEDTKKLGITPNANPFLAPKMVAAISRIAAEKVYQGVVKFDKLVKDVLDEVREYLPDWKEEDVVNHLLSTKDKNGNYIPTTTSEAYLKSKKLVDNSSETLKTKIKAYETAQKDVAVKQFQWDKDRRLDMMKNRPVRERIIDNILRLQRFAVLFYPTTFVKLLGVVGHQLLLKPFKFALQKLVHTLTPKSITSKQAIWGNPEWSSLGKYYSAFVRNFALSNLKEQFSGIDTKELLYGKPMMYDEWNAASGLLEMPGRSHGYIKSFIKNPEFAFAHEQQIAFNIKKMAEIQKELSKPDLKDKQKQNLQNEYDNYDITNEDVMERVNKISLEHGKWAILMNDNKFVEKFQKFTRDAGIAGALIKSELPIVKIPSNYIGRYFALKYGLIRAIIGKPKWESKTNSYPGIAQLLIKGTKDLKPEQAELLGKSLTVGSFGASLFALGYILSNQIGSDDDDHKDGLNIGGVHISKNLIHSPEIESFLSGVNVGKAKEQDKKFIQAFVENDIEVFSKNPFLQTLQYGFLVNTSKAIDGLVKGRDEGDIDKFENKMINAVGKKITDMTIPGFVKQPAQWFDTKESGFHPTKEPTKRTPKGDPLEMFWQNIELGIPGLRQNVPESKKH